MPDSPTSPLLPTVPDPPPPAAAWGELIPDNQWRVFHAALFAARSIDVPVLLGGAMALAAYTDHWRDTKDIDFVLRPGDAPRLRDALLAAGFTDYFNQEEYDRSWIFRAWRDEVVLDLIWELPNHRVEVDELWFQRATPVNLRGEVHYAMPAEEIVRVKLYVMQRGRCDWVDVLNVLAGAVERIDWSLLVARMGRDLPLLHGVLAVFNWMCPGRARHIPQRLRTQFALPDIEGEDATMEERRVRLLESRPWFAAHQPVDRPLER